MKKLLFFLFIIALFNFTGNNLVYAKSSMTIAVHDYAPYYDENGKGMLIDLYKAAGEAGDIDVKFTVLPVKRAVEYLFENKVEAFSPGNIFLSPEQISEVSAINTFNVYVVYVFYDPKKEKEFIFNSFADLKGKKFGSIVNSPFVEGYKGAGLTTYEMVETPEILIKMLRGNRLELVENTLLTCSTLLNKYYKNEMGNFNYSVGGIPLKCYLSFYNGNPKTKELMAKFEKGFGIIKRNGTYMRIFEDYWGKGNVPKQVLPDDIQRFGKEKASFKQFSQYERNDWSKIIK